MTIQDILFRLKAEATKLRKEAIAYGKQAGLSDLDCSPNDVPPDKLCYAYSAGAYNLSAKAMEDIIKSIERAMTKGPSIIRLTEDYMDFETGVGFSRGTILYRQITGQYALKDASLGDECVWSYAPLQPISESIQD